jgi:hypothetical protein
MATVSTNRAAVAASFENKLKTSGSLTPAGATWLSTAIDPLTYRPAKTTGYPDSINSNSVVLEIVRTINITGFTAGGSPNQLTVGPDGTCIFYLSPFFNFAVGSGNSDNASNNFGSCGWGVLQIPPAATASGASGVPGQVGLNENPLNSMIYINTGDPQTLAASPYYNLQVNSTNGGLCITNSSIDPAFISNPQNSFFPACSSVLNHNILQPHRVIAAGFEVVNETSSLYMQGNVQVFEVSSSWTDLDAGMFPTGIAQSGSPERFMSYLRYKMCNGPPSTTGMAINMLNSAQWAASKGAYCVAKLAGLDNQVQLTSPPYPAATSTAPNQLDVNTNGVSVSPTLYGCGGAYVAQNVNAAWPVVPATTNPTVNNPALYHVTNAPTCAVYPFNGVGAWFSGLNPNNTSLQVTVKWYVEVFPNPYWDSELVPLAKQSAGFDPVTLHAYAQLATKLPPGVPAGSSMIARIPGTSTAST